MRIISGSKKGHTILSYKNKEMTIYNKWSSPVASASSPFSFDFLILFFEAVLILFFEAILILFFESFYFGPSASGYAFLLS